MNNLITKFFEDRKAKKAEISLEVEKIVNEAREKANHTLRLYTEAMLEKSCPINGRSCDELCVHFNEGDINEYAHGMSVIPPSCKLWRAS